MKTINLYALFVGLIVFLVINYLLGGIENTIFWSVVMQFREASGGDSSFQVAREYQVAINPKVLFYHFLFIAISYGAASAIIVSNAKQKIFIHLIIFVVAVELIRKIYFYMRSSQEFFEFPLLIVAEVFFAISICLLVGTVLKNKKHITSH